MGIEKWDRKSEVGQLSAHGDRQGEKEDLLVHGGQVEQASKQKHRHPKTIPKQSTVPILLTHGRQRLSDPLKLLNNSFLYLLI